MWLSDNILSDSSIFSQARFARQFQIIFFLDNHVENNKILSENNIISKTIWKLLSWNNIISKTIWKILSANNIISKTLLKI